MSTKSTPSTKSTMSISSIVSIMSIVSHRSLRSFPSPSPNSRILLTIAITTWVIGASAYYIIRLTQTFYQENQTPIQNAIANLFGGS